MSHGHYDHDLDQYRSSAARHRRTTDCQQDAQQQSPARHLEPPARNIAAGRRLGVVGAAATLSALLLVPAAVSADPASPSGKHPATSISQVQARLDTLNHQAEVATEAYDTVKVAMQQAQARMTGLQADLDRERSRVAALRSAIVGAALSDFSSSGGLSTSSSFLVAKKPSEFIQALATTAVVEHRQAALLTQFRQQQNELGIQEQQAERELSSIQADRAELAKQRSMVESKLADARKLLGQLKAKARQRVLALQRQAEATAAAVATSRATIRPPTSAPTSAPVPAAAPAPAPAAPPAAAPASGRAAVAVATALAQLGKPYVWATAGPNTFDCSGLTMYAWAAAGVSLSHSSSVQSQEGVPVSISSLQPGDLVFYYSPVSHVAMYIGNGQVVHAPHTGSVVQIVPLTSMPIAWARRVG